MSDIQGPARLGKDPVLKFIGDDKKPVCELRVNLQNFRKNKDDPDKPIDSGFWAQVNVWGKCAEPSSKLFSKGDRVFIIGDMDQDTFKDKESGEDVTIFHINSNVVLPWTQDLESIQYKERKTQKASD